MLYKYRFIIYGFFILIFALSFGTIFISLSGKEDSINYNTKTRELNGIFSVYDGKVYALVPSNGYYEVKDANASAFKIIPDSFADAHIGYDDHHVYAGNIILEGLDPKKLKVLGNNYYTDGTITYYCARNSEKNEALSAVGFIIRLAGQSMGLADKPQNYWYPFVELSKGKVYQSKQGFAVAGSAEVAFFKGLEMKDSDPETIRPVKAHYWDRDVRDSDSYFTDGKKIYYENHLLPLAYNEEIHQIEVEGDIPSRSAYLLNPKNGMVYVNGQPFDQSKAPYRLLGINLAHANQALFVSKDGFYFYDTEAEKVERAGDNPFADNQFQEIAPDVYTSGNKVYFLKASENWSRKRGLRGRTTHLLELKGLNASSLKKITTHDSRYGSVWQSGNRYFYFDNLGSSQLMPSSIYEINDLATLKLLADSNNIGTDEIRNLSRDNKLTKAEGETILTATTKYASDWDDAYWLILGIVAFFAIIAFLLRNKKLAPFLVKDGYLIMNNLLFTKYKISDIDKVIFRMVSGYYKVGSYIDEMQVLMKNGKTGRKTIFTTKFTLTSETESDVVGYIIDLRNELRKEGIDSEFVR